jgi:hypothetical protein
MEFTTFIRRPFKVEAVEVTRENIEEIAKDVGKIRHDDQDRPYIYVDRRIVPNVYNVWPGYWMTKMGDNVRFYSKKAFRNQFIESTPEIEELIPPIETLETPRLDQNISTPPEEDLVGS